MPEILPIYSEEDQLGDKGVRIVNEKISDELKWVFREQPKNDFGIDAFVEIINESGRATGRLIAFQIKCGHSYFKEKNENGFIYRGSQKHLNYWTNHSLPVVVTISNPDTKETHWVEVTRNNVVLLDKGWWVLIPKSNLLCNEDKNALKAIVAQPRSELQGVLKKIQDENEAKIFFTDVVKRKPILCRSFEFEGKAYIIGFYEKPSQYIGKMQHICVLNQFANKWQVFFDEKLDEYDCYPKLSDKCEVIIHNGNIFFYFERLIQNIGTMFNGHGVAKFSVFDFNKKTINTLFYEGRYRDEGVEGAFNFDLLSQNPDSKVYEFILEQEASKSKYIYRTPKDYNLDDPENFIEKWNVENPDFYKNERGQVIFNLYDESILWDSKRYSDIDAYKSNTPHVENSSYIMFYYFAGPILGMRKSDGKYFVALVPQGYGGGGTWGLRSIKSVEFLTGEKIFAKNDYESYEIDLATGQYIRKYFGAAFNK